MSEEKNITVEEIQPTPPTKKIGVVALISMILGIVSFILVASSLFLYAVVGSVASLVLSIIGLVFVKKGKCRGKGFAITGLVTSILGIVAFIVWIFIIIMVIIAFGEAFGEALGEALSNAFSSALK